MNKETKIDISILYQDHRQDQYGYKHQDIDEGHQQEDFGIYLGPINDEAPEYDNIGIYQGHEYEAPEESNDFDNTYIDQENDEDWREYEHPRTDTENDFYEENYYDNPNNRP